MKNQLFIRATVLSLTLLISSIHGETITITNENQFNSAILKEDSFAVVKAGAKWCSYCVTSEKPFKDLSNDPSLKHVTFATLDVDANAALSEKYNIKNLPTILFFKNGKLLQKKEGYPDALKSEILRLEDGKKKEETTVQEPVKAAKEEVCDDKIGDYFKKMYESAKEYFNKAVDTVKSWFK